jgi:hypothetical protein
MNRKLCRTQNICEPEQRHSKRGRDDGKDTGGVIRPMRYRLPSAPVPRLAVPNVCIRNGQRSSEISCDKETRACLSLRDMRCVASGVVVRIDGGRCCGQFQGAVPVLA